MQKKQDVWENHCKETHFSNQFGDYVKIEGIEIECNSNYWIYIKKEDVDLFNSGKSFDNVFGTHSTDLKEFLINGKAPTYTCKLTNEKKVTHKAYVTNASANSVVFYAMSYLNNMGLTLSQIIKLREKYSLGNLENKYFSKEELRESFLNQSAFFANLYKSMNENDRFENFIDDLESSKKFSNIFSRYKNGTDLKKQYDRKIFHQKFECQSMTNDFSESGTYHENTGVFSSKKVITKEDFYVVEIPFLEILQMRMCKKCLWINI